MSATVLPFSGDWQGRFEPANAELEAQNAAMADARRIMAAKDECNDWTATLLVSLLTVLDPQQLTKLELALCTKAESLEAADKALGLVRVANRGKGHSERVQAAIDALLARGA